MSLLRFICATLCGLCLVASTAHFQASAQENATAKIGAALKMLQHYESTGVLSDLESAISMMDGTVILPIAPQDFMEFRRLQVRAWAQILKVIERSYDPAFDPADPKNVPVTSMVPPPERNGRQLASCADPKDVQDPVARKQYVAEIQENNERIARANRYVEIHNLDERAMSSLEMTLNLLAEVASRGEPPDYIALDGILRDAGINVTRRLHIDAELRDPALGYVTVPGRSVRALFLTLEATLRNEDAAVLASQYVEVWGPAKGAEVLFAPSASSQDVQFFDVDTVTAKVQRLIGPSVGMQEGVAMSALDARAIVELYREMLSGSLAPLPPQSDFSALDFSLQERNFDRSHKLPHTKYYIAYVPEKAPATDGRFPCGYFENYEIDTSTWSVQLRPLPCQRQWLSGGRRPLISS